MGVLSMWQNARNGLALPFVAIPVREGRLPVYAVIESASGKMLVIEPEPEPEPPDTSTAVRQPPRIGYAVRLIALILVALPAWFYRRVR